MALRAELFFGRMKKSDHPAMAPIWIGDQQFTLFLRRKLSTFPGFTHIPADGWWKGEKEPSSVVVIYGPNTEAFKLEIGNIARAYADEFKQDGVAFSFDEVPFYIASADAVGDAFPDDHQLPEDLG